jgi:hypothetical protein
MRPDSRVAPCPRSNLVAARNRKYNKDKHEILVAETTERDEKVKLVAKRPTKHTVIPVAWKSWSRVVLSWHVDPAVGPSGIINEKLPRRTAPDQRLVV